MRDPAGKGGYRLGNVSSRSTGVGVTSRQDDGMDHVLVPAGISFWIVGASLSELIDCEVRAGILSVPTDDGLT